MDQVATGEGVELTRSQITCETWMSSASTLNPSLDVAGSHNNMTFEYSARSSGRVGNQTRCGGITVDATTK